MKPIIRGAWVLFTLVAFACDQRTKTESVAPESASLTVPSYVRFVVNVPVTVSGAAVMLAFEIAREL